MSIFVNTYPYTDNHELNADWIIQKVQELDAKVDKDITDTVETITKETLNNMLITATYDSTTETILIKEAEADE